jgi:5,10-methylenetetrahydromethanopterin reductase
MTIRISAELSHICPLEEITSQVVALETYGFYRIWVPDTVFSPWDAWLAASLIMQTTSRIQIGLGVTNPYTRHPVVVAQMAATMQQYTAWDVWRSPVAEVLVHFSVKPGLFSILWL